MLDYLRLNGVELLDYTTADGNGHRDLSRVEGLTGLATPRGESKARTEQHGSRNRNRWLGSKIVTLEGEAWGKTVADAVGQFIEVEAAAYAALTAEAGALLQWGIGGLNLQSYVKLVGSLLTPIESPAAELVWQGQFEQTDPRAYAQAMRSVAGGALSAGGGGLLFGLKFPLKFNESAGGIAAVVNAGKIETPPVVRVYAGGVAPLVSPRYVLGSSGLGVKINGTVGIAEYIEVDHDKRTVKINGATLRMNLLDLTATTFFDVPIGASQVKLLAQNFGAGAYIEVDTRDAYA